MLCLGASQKHLAGHNRGPGMGLGAPRPPSDPAGLFSNSQKLGESSLSTSRDNEAPHPGTADLKRPPHGDKQGQAEAQSPVWGLPGGIGSGVCF